MRRTGYNFRPDVGGEATVVSARFDEAAERRAHRVVPLRAFTRQKPPNRGATWGDLFSLRGRELFPRRVKDSLSRGLQNVSAGARRHASFVVPLLVLVSVVGLALGARRSEPRAQETSAPAAVISGSTEAQAQGEPEGQFVVVPVVRPREERPARAPRREAREAWSRGEAELIGTFVVPHEAFADEAKEERKEKKMRGRERARAEGAEELDKLAERLTRGHDARRLKDFLEELEQ